MNIQSIDRRILLTHLHAVEEKFPLRFVGLLAENLSVLLFGDHLHHPSRLIKNGGFGVPPEEESAYFNPFEFLPCLFLG